MIKTQLRDFYFDKRYVELYCEKGSTAVEFEYEIGNKRFYNIGIKSPILEVAGQDVKSLGVHDLSTAYGYGGYLVNTDDTAFIADALEAYSNWCRQHRIIADFVRFQPVLELGPLFEDQLSFFTRNNDTVVVDLTIDQEERWTTYSSNTRNILRRCSRDLVIEPMDSVDEFIRLYYETMRRNEVSGFYYFDKTYFEGLLSIEGVKLWGVYYQGELASAGFFLYSEDYGHYHLSANDRGLSKHNANYLLLEHAIEFGHSSGRSKFHLGGGRTPSPDDGLFRFKKKFAPNGTIPFYIGGQVHDAEMYQHLNKTWDTENPEDERRYFLKYRLQPL